MPTVYKTFHAEAEVDLDDFSDEELRSELIVRGKSVDGAAIPPLSGEEPHPLHEIYYAMKFGMNEKAAELMRAYVNDQLGTAL